MTASPVLADSCWYIEAMRKGRNPMRELHVIAFTRDLATCGVVQCEVGRGLKDPALRKKFQARWDIMLYVPTDNALWTEAERTLWELDRKGIVLPLTDVVIACCARRIGAVILTHDEHFQKIPGVRATDRIL